MIDQKTQLWTGICKANTSIFEYFPRLLQYPGETCDGVRAVYDCASGYRKCKAHRCLGYPAGSKCLSSFDCNPNFFCDSVSQECKPVHQDGQKCYSSQECQKNSLCKFDSQIAQSGVCQQMFSMSPNTYLYAWSQEDLFMCSGGYGLLVDQKGVINPFSFESGLYQCGGQNPLKSLKSGQACKSYVDCTSTQSGIYAQCGCSLSSTDQICGILQDNTEFQDYISAVRHNIIFQLLGQRIRFSNQALSQCKRLGQWTL
ncbi:UNKNOWN [Stylonychia lemnae]|uniref:Uncharacterized protein n=1 Tax=Stylonychia lemnae TaxID=5949 RepID=A0A078ARP4_STYLE|nr:UNKNOWN [Stylonychia lemnae]|eukprot:CDW83523.1 UNKNOWN [Stylonychia lemnae]